MYVWLQKNVPNYEDCPMCEKSAKAVDAKMHQLKLRINPSSLNFLSCSNVRVELPICIFFFLLFICFQLVNVSDCLWLVSQLRQMVYVFLNYLYINCTVHMENKICFALRQCIHNFSKMCYLFSYIHFSIVHSSPVIFFNHFLTFL
jgi:hypothetical protein